MRTLITNMNFSFVALGVALGGVYVALSVCCCILGIFLGKKLSILM